MMYDKITHSSSDTGRCIPPWRKIIYLHIPVFESALFIKVIVNAMNLSVNCLSLPNKHHDDRVKLNKSQLYLTLLQDGDGNGI